MSQVVRVLIIDDDTDDRLLFCEAIGEIRSSIECIEASNGGEALSFLEEFENKKPSLIFLDIDMPLMNGWDTLKAIRKIDSANNIPVILYSSFQTTSNVEHELQKQFLFFWSKPDSYAQILKTLTVILSSEVEDIRSAVVGLPDIFHLG